MNLCPAAVWLSVFAAGACAAEAPPVLEHPAARQCLEQLNGADADHDGFVTREELRAYMAKQRPGKEDEIVEAMMKMLDTDHDGKLSVAEREKAAILAVEHYAHQVSIERAQRVTYELDNYRKSHDGKNPETLEELKKLPDFPAETLKCLLRDGQERPWGYNPASGKDGVILYNSESLEGQYIVGRFSGKVLGLQDDEVEAKTLPGITFHD